MVKHRIVVSAALLGILLSGAIFTHAVKAQVVKGKSRPLLIKQLMKGLISAQCAEEVGRRGALGW